MSDLLSDAETSAPPKNLSHLDWLEKHEAVDPVWVAKFTTLVKGWWAKTHAQQFATKNALAKYIRSHESSPKVSVQTIVAKIEEMKG